MKKIILLTLTLILVLPVFINAKELKEDWNFIIDETNNSETNDFIETEDNGFIIVGKTKESSGSSIDGFIAKYNENKEEVWKKTWGGTKNDTFEQIFLLNDGGYLVIGEYYSKDIENTPNTGLSDTIIIKYDSKGEMIWQKSFGTEDYNRIFDLKITSKDEIIFLLMEGSDYLAGSMVKCDSTGNEMWKKSLEKPGFMIYSYDHTYKIELTKDEDIIINAANFMRKISPEGEIIWEREIEQVRGPNIFYSYKIAEDNSIIAVGTIEDQEKMSLAYIVKYDKDGNEIWSDTQSYGSINAYAEVEILSNGDIVAVANYIYISSDGTLNGTKFHARINRYNSKGELIKETDIEHPYDNQNHFYWNMLYETSDNGVLLIGTTFITEESTLNIIKIDKNGTFERKVESNGWNIISTNLKFLKSDDEIIVYGYNVDYISLYSFNRKGELIWKYNENCESAINNIKRVILTENKKLIVLNSQYMSSKNKNTLAQIYYEYKIEKAAEEVNGSSTVEQLGTTGIITTQPNKGYKVNKIIVKDSTGQTIETTQQTNGTYTFELYDDVTIEVLYMEDINNPKTGILDVITILFTGMIISLGGFFFVKKYNERYEI